MHFSEADVFRNRCMPYKNREFATIQEMHYLGIFPDVLKKMLARQSDIR